jgi:hypothetical protein
MATGAAPALEPNKEIQPQDQQEAQAKPSSLVGRIVHKLLTIFEHNERLGSTRS